MRVIVFGDSITQGFFDSQGGWATRLARKYHHDALKDLLGDWPAVFNLGVSGDTVKNVLDRAEHEIKSRYRNDEDVLTIVAVGINDSLLIDNKAFKDVYDFQEEYEKLVDKVAYISDKTLFIGLTAVDEKLASPYAGSNTGKQYLNNRINLFEDCIKQVCTLKDVPFVPIHDAFLAKLENGAHLLADGLHPNDAGHEWLFERIEPVVKKLL